MSARNQDTSLKQYETHTDISWSGPVAIPLKDEARAIQAAPAYDTEQAKRYITAMPALRSLIDSIPEDRSLICFGKCIPQNAALRHLETEIRHILDDGHKISLVMADLKTLSGVSFCSDMWMCSQSTIKAIYTGSVLDSFPRAFHDNGQYIRDAIVLSDNLAYERLRGIYGKDPLRKWCREAGVDESFADPPYPRDKTARDMFKMWTRLYCFLNDGSDISNAGRYFAASAMSAAREYLGESFPLQTKAGWENGIGDEADESGHPVIEARFTDGDPLNDECATNDTGVVYAENGPYLFVIYSDYPCPSPQANRLAGVTKALHAVQAGLQDAGTDHRS